MNPTNNSKTRRAFNPRAAATGLLASVVLGAMLGTSSHADMYRAATNAPGGVPAQSTITSVTPVGTNAIVCWYGMQGWYSVEASVIGSNDWTSVARTAASAHAWCQTVYPGSNSLGYEFRLNQNNAYVGSGGCAGCHGDKYNKWVGTHHASAFGAITNEALQAGELIYRTVGKGQPTGFTDATNTPHLRNVGCENCHGPAAWHKYSDHDLIRPAVSLDPKICGGCHEGIYDEYQTSLHAEVVGAVYDTVTNITNSAAITAGYDRQMTCGACHSAATRLAMLKDYEARLQGWTNALVLPVGADAGAWGPSCATCHDPHQTRRFTNIVSSSSGPITNVVEAQMRNPLRSTNYYTLPTTSDKRTVIRTNFQGAVTTNIVYYNTTFASLYDPNVQVCAQCHNTRGARWDNRSYGLITNGASITVGLLTNISSSWRYPHYSPQYNMLIGIVQGDYFHTNSSGVATNWLQRHGTSVSSTTGNFNEKQCVTCHVPSYQDGTGAQISGHTFNLDTRGCELSGCHSTGRPSIEEAQHTTKDGLARVVSLLNQWATNKAPAILGATDYNKHLVNSWEYTTIGGLATITNAGPAGTNQAKIPDVIKQARFNAYMVKQDGSYGLHNPRYATALITNAESKVLSQFPLANFTASRTAGFAPTNIVFTSLGTGVTGWDWAFGDGNTSTAANPTNTYASPGLYSVRLTATDPSGSETVVRTGYIQVAARPVVSFTGGPELTNTAPLTVNFTNTSTSTNSVVDWRWYIDGQSIWSQDAVYTFTNVGNYDIQLRAYTPGGSVTVTSTNFVVVTAP
jgi:PKD repeat protein